MEMKQDLNKAMIGEDILLRKQPFLMYRKNLKFINGKRFWTGEQESNFVIFVLLLSIVVIIVGFIILGPVLGYRLNYTSGMGGWLLIIFALISIGLLTVIYGIKFWLNLRLNRFGKLLFGEVTDFEILDGETVTIKVKYQFNSSENKIIFGKAASPLSYSNHVENSISIGKPIVVQYLKDDEHYLL